jgi:hypothetical protein
MTKAPQTKWATILSLFRGHCGHEWVGSTSGSFACPVCGEHDGDHNIASMEEIPVQVDDWGTAWSELNKAILLD